MSKRYEGGVTVKALFLKALSNPRRAIAAADVENQPRRALDALDVVLEIHAALEAVRSVAREVEAARAPGDRIGVEKRRLEEHVLRGRVGLGALAAHDAGEADDARIVGDAEHRLVDFDLLLVQQEHFLAF